MLIFAHLGAHAGGGFVVLRQTQPEPGCTSRVIGAGQHQRVLLGRNRGQCEVVIAVGDRHCSEAVFSRGAFPWLGKSDGGCCSAAANRALILPEALVLVVQIDGPGKGVAGMGLTASAPRKMGQATEPVPGLVGQKRCESRARLIGKARPGDAVGGLVVAMIAHRGDKHLAHRVPDHRCGRVAIRSAKRSCGPCTSVPFRR